MGCYLSHYTIWKKIIDRSYEWCLILEDDADVTQFKNYVASNYNVSVKQDVDVVQLNKRTQHGNLEEYFNGTTSYLINKRASLKFYWIQHTILVILISVLMMFYNGE